MSRYNSVVCITVQNLGGDAQTFGSGLGSNRNESVKLVLINCDQSERSFYLITVPVEFQLIYITEFSQVGLLVKILMCGMREKMRHMR